MNKVLNKVAIALVALTLVVGINAFATFPTTEPTTNTGSANTSLLSPSTGSTTTGSASTGSASTGSASTGSATTGSASTGSTTTATGSNPIKTDEKKSESEVKTETQKEVLPEAGASKLVFVGMAALAVITGFMYKKATK